MTAPVLAPALADRGLEPWRPCAVRSLDDAISVLWARISAHQLVACPLCRGEMEPQYGAEAAPLGGRCRDCGSVLT